MNKFYFEMGVFGNVCYVYRDVLHCRFRFGKPIETIHFVKYEYGYEKEETGDWVPENFQIRAMFRHDGLDDLKPYTSLEHIKKSFNRHYKEIYNMYDFNKISKKGEIK